MCLGSLVGSSILFGVRGLECFRSRLDRRSDVSPHQLSHSGSDRLPLQTSRCAARENPLKVSEIVIVCVSRLMNDTRVVKCTVSGGLCRYLRRAADVALS